MGFRTVALAAFLCAAIAPSAAFGGELDLSAAVEVGQMHGHDPVLEYNGLLGVPILNAAYRSGPWQIHVETQPSLFLSHNAGTMTAKYLHLAYDDAAVRYWLPGNRIALGIGTTLWNESGSYSFPSGGGTDSVTRSSRMASARFEGVLSVPISHRDDLQLTLGESPSIHAQCNIADSWLPGVPFARSMSGSLFDGSLQDTIKGKSLTLFYGVRYVNLETNFTGGAQAYENQTWTAYGGVNLRLGHP